MPVTSSSSPAPASRRRAAFPPSAALASKVPKLTLVTQNVDDLHERAGSEGAIHLHGSLFAPRCFTCGRPASLALEIPNEPEGGRRVAPPRCVDCAGPVRPGVIWFGEALSPSALARAGDLLPALVERAFPV